jgi:hypothetical protein
VPIYSGSCHCGAVKFRIDADAIASGVRCNCSICIRRGATMSVLYFPPSEIAVEGKDALTLYVWGDRMVNNYFCATCGVYTFHEAIEKPGHLRVNLGCIDGVDPHAVAVTMIDGRSY